MSRSKYSVRLIDEGSPNSPMSEAFKQLRTNIDFSNVDRDLKVIMMTSSNIGEGKSTASANAAIAFAQTGRRVLLIDGDLRNPSLHLIFHVPNQVGLTTVLSQQKRLEEVIQPAAVADLHLIPSGALPASPTEMLSSKAMKDLLQELKEQYDVIIIDTPPLLVASDAQITAALSDGVILVVHSGKVKKEEARKAKANLDMVNARVIGAILNNVNRRKVAGYY